MNELEKIVKERYPEKNEITQRYIVKSIQKHGDIYDYSKAIYQGKGSKTTIICPTHGEFEVDFGYFATSQYCLGCPWCFPKVTGKSDLPRFIKKVEDKFPGHSFDFSQSVYQGSSVRMNIGCRIHGLVFSQSPSNLLYGKVGCPKCREEMKWQSRDLTVVVTYNQRFIDLGYPETQVTSKIGKEVTLQCNACGSSETLSFSTLQSRVAAGFCCLECRDRQKREERKQKFIEKALRIHGDKYDYSGIIYHDETLIENIRCNNCGKIFSINMSNHFRGPGGCDCRYRSLGELNVISWLTKNGISYKEEVPVPEIQGKKEGWGVRIDFALTLSDGTVMWIECNGEQHYSFVPGLVQTTENYYAQLQRDQNVRDYCAQNSIVLLEIPWTYYRNDRLGIVLTKAIIEHNFQFTDYITYPEIKESRGK